MMGVNLNNGFVEGWHLTVTSGVKGGDNEAEGMRNGKEPLSTATSDVRSGSAGTSLPAKR